MSNEEIVILIKCGMNTAENTALLYNQVKSFIHSIAWKFRYFEDIQDLEQEGYLALYPAIDGFNPEYGCLFLTYAEYYIKQGMRRYIQNNGSALRLSVHRQEKLQRLKKFQADFEKEYGHTPTEQDSCRFLGLSPKQYQEWGLWSRASRCISLDEPVRGQEQENIVLGDTIAAPGDLEKESIERQQGEELASVLWECVDGLHGAQPDILRGRYQYGKTLSRIAQERGTTREAVRQQEAKALRELRKPKNSKRLRPYLPDTEQIYGMALVGNGLDKFNHSWTSSTERVALRLAE